MEIKIIYAIDPMIFEDLVNEWMEFIELQGKLKVVSIHYSTTQLDTREVKYSVLLYLSPVIASSKS